MKKSLMLFLVILTLGLLGNVWAQTMSDFTFATSTTASLENMSTGTTSMLTAAAYHDDDASALTNIGFTFPFQGTYYTQFSANSNGQMRLGSTVISGGSATPSAGYPLIAPLSGDNSVQSTGKVHYLLAGSAPNRRLIVEWYNLRVNFADDTGLTYCTLQAVIYETTGKIEFNYGRMYNNSTSTQTRSAFISTGSSAGTIGEVTSIITTPAFTITGTSLAGTVFPASSDMTNLNSLADGSRRQFSFTPQFISAVSLLSPADASTTVGRMPTLSWGPGAGWPATSYNVYMDGANPPTTLVYNGSAQSYTPASNLDPLATYYWKVVPYYNALVGTSAQRSFTTIADAPLTGTKAIPGDYATIAAAITAVNVAGVGAGGVTFNINPGYTETAPTGGFRLTASGTSANPLIFQKSGAGTNPLITAYTGGTGTPGTAVPDGIWFLVGSDYVTIDGIDLQENAANTTNPSTMEFGYGLFKSGVLDGAQYNTIKNCVITLNRINFASGSGPMVDGSAGIAVMNSIPTAAATALTPTAATGTNSYNKFYTNTIQNANTGIGIVGYAASLPFTLGDTGNDIGGTAAGTGNTIKNYGGGASATNPAAGIRVNNQWGINISYNTINNNDGAGVNHVSTLRGIYAAAGTSANATIDHNTVTIKGGATTSSIYGIDNGIGSTAAGNTVNITYNNVTGTYTTATSGSFYAIQNTATAATMNVNNNTVHDISTSGTGGLYGILNSGAAGTNILNANNNSVTTLTKTGNGLIYGLQFGTATTTATGNTIDGLTCTAAAATAAISGIHSASSAVLETYSNNVIRNFSSTGAATLRGIFVGTAAGNKTVQNNQVYSFTTGNGGTQYGIHKTYGAVDDISGNQIYSLVVNGTTSGTIYGIYNSAGTTVNIYSNKIYTLSNNAGTSGTLAGIYFSTAATNNVYKNKIYDIATGSSNPSLYGIYAVSGTTNTIYNNIVADLRTPSANAAIPLAGIYVAGGTTANVYFNTVRLAATGGVTLFGSAAIYASTTPTLKLRNNILINTSSTVGTGVAAVLRRNGVLSATYDASSNNNLYYCAQTATNPVYYDGTTAQATLAAFKGLTGLAPRDAASVTENPPFLNTTTGANADYLHINTAVNTQIESGAVNIAGITDDFDGVIRFGNTGYIPNTPPPLQQAPDLGADEGFFTPQDLTPPSITYTQLTNVSTSVTTTTINAVITDGTGVNVTAPKIPRVYYRKGNGVLFPTWYYTVGSNTSGSNWSFTINHSDLGTLAVGDTVQYFVVAKDTAPAGNIGSLPFGATGDVDAITGYPSPYQYKIVYGVAGNYNVGASETYTSLTGTTGFFNYINNGIVTGNVTVTITTDLAETGAVALNQTNEEGVGSYTITVQPSEAVNKTLKGNYAGALVRLNGADRVTFDGRYSGAGKYLTVMNTNASAVGIALVKVADGQGATNNTIKYCTIKTDINTSATIAISIEGDADNTLIDNNSIIKSFTGITTSSATATSLINNLTISNNMIGDATIDSLSVGSLGMQVQYTDGFLIDKNTIVNLKYGTNGRGVFLSTGAINGTVSRNTIDNITYTGTSGYGGKGIDVATAASCNITIVNNMITRMTGDGWNNLTTDSVVGIRILTPTTGVKIYFNTVYLSGTCPRTSSTLSAALYLHSSAAAMDIKNNIFSNSIVNDNSSGTSSIAYAIYSAVGSAGFTDINYNDYYASGIQGKLGYLGGDITTLAAWATATTKDANSINIDPEFIGTSNAHIQVASPNVNDKGTYITTVNNDIDGDARSTSARTLPDLGADEYAYAPIIPNPAVLVSPTPTGAGNVAVTPTLQWASGGGGATSYDVYYWLASDSEPTSPIVNQTGLSYQITTPLNYYALYNWKIVPRTPAGPATDSYTCPTWTFTTVKAPLTGTLTISSTGSPDYATFTAANADINLRGVAAGGVTFNVTGSFTENVVFTYNATAANPIVFQAGARTNPVISAAVGTGSSDAIVTFNGCDYITFDGIDLAENVANTTSTTQAEYGLWVKNVSVTDGAQHNTFKNATITLNKANTGSRGIYQYYNTTPTATTGAQSYNQYKNVTITNTYSGMYLYGNSSASYNDTDNEVSNCTIGGSGANDIGATTSGSTTYGVNTYYQTNLKFNNNEVRNVTQGSSSYSAYGVYMSALTGTINIYNNKVHDISFAPTSTTSYLVYGMNLSLNSSGTNTANIYNNMVYNLNHGFSGTETSTALMYGVYLGSSNASNTVNFDFNSVRVTCPTTGNSTAIRIPGGTNGVFKIRNNVFANLTGAQTTGRHEAFLTDTVGSIGSVGSVSDHNVLYVSNSTRGFVACASTTNYNTISAWTAAVSQDANSRPTDPMFVASPDLHIQTGVGTPVESKGSYFGGAITWVTTDIDGDLRATESRTAPDMGADEGSFTIEPTCQEPLAQPTGLALVPYSLSITGSFTASDAQKYLVVKSSVAHDTPPTDMVDYDAGATLGNGTVVQSGSLTTFNSTGLTVETGYVYTVYAYNWIGVGAPNYKPDGAPSATATTLPAAPTAPTLPNPTVISMTQIDLVPASTNNIIVVYNTVNTFGTPLSTNYYNVSDVLPGGGTVMYNGVAGATINHTGLWGNTTYYYKAFAYTTSGSYYNYSTAASNSATTTRPDNTTSFTATPTGTTQINLAAAGTSPILVAWNSTNTFGTPDPTVTYTGANASSITGGGTVWYVGDIASLPNHTGLTPNTAYYYKVWSYASTNGRYAYSVGYSPSVATTYSVVPVTTSFEGSSSLPTGWTTVGTKWNVATTTGSYGESPRTGTNYIKCTYSSTAADWLFSPGVYLQASKTYDMTYWFKTDGYPNWQSLKTSIGTSATAEGMNPIAADSLYYPDTNTYIRGGKVNYTPAVDGIYFVGFNVTALSTPWYMSFDDFSIVEHSASPEAPVYTYPLNAATNRMIPTVLNWINGGTVTKYDLYLSSTQADVDNKVAGALIASNVTSPLNSYTLNSLNWNTTYYWRIVAKNDASRATADGAVYSFTTATADPTITTIPYLQTFDSGVTTPALPAGWTANRSYTTYTGTSTTYTNVGTSSSGAQSSPNCAFVYNGAYGSPMDILLVTPPIQSALNYNAIGFYAKGPVDSLIVVGTMTDPNNKATFTPFASQPITAANSSTWKQYAFDLGAYTGTDKYIALKIDKDYRSANSQYIYFDNIVLVPRTYTDYSVTGLTATPLYKFTDLNTSLTATITNLGVTSTGIDVVFKADAIELGTVNTGVLIPGASKTVNLLVNITPAGTYTLTANAPTDEVTSNNVASLASQTVYPAGSLAEGFEDALFPPTRWLVWGNTPTYTTWTKEASVSANAQETGGVSNAKLVLTDVANSFAHIATPRLVIGTGSTLSFYAKTSAVATPYPQIQVKYSTLESSTNPADWTVLGTTNLFTLSNTYAQYSVDLADLIATPGIYRIAFNAVANGSTASVYLDKVVGPTIYAPAEAPGLAGLVAPIGETIDPKTVLFDWTAPETGGIPNFYTINYNVTGQPIGDNTLDINAPVTQYQPYTATPKVTLLYGKEYSWQVIPTLFDGYNYFYPDSVATWTFRTKAQMQATSPLAIGSIQPTVVKTGTFAIQNIGDTDLTFDVTSKPADIVFGGTLPYTIPANSTYNLPYTFTGPGANGAYSQTFIITETSPGTSSKEVTITATVENPSTFTIGTGTSGTSSMPFYYSYNYSWGRMLYTKAEINAAGLTNASNITSIAFNVTNTPADYLMTNQAVYMRLSSATAETSTYTPNSDAGYAQYYAGDLTFNGSGWYTITLSTPFAWDNVNNIEVLWENNDGESNTTGYPTFAYTYLYSPYLAAYYYSNTDVATSGYTTSYRPNIRFGLPVEATGSVSGYVTTDGVTPMVGATVSIGGTSFSTVTGTNGRYNFPAVSAGTYNVTSSKTNYYPQTASLTVNVNATTTHDFTMVQLPLISISGHVVGNDLAPVSGVSITIGSYTPVTTDASGNFTVSGVYGEQAYSYTIFKSGWQSQAGTVTVAAINYDMGTLNIVENIYPAYTVLATDAGSSVNLSWTAAGPPPVQNFDFETTNGGFTATNWATPGWDWGTSSYAGAHGGSKIWGSVLSGNYGVTGTQGVYGMYDLVSPSISVMTGASLSFWHRYHFEGTTTYFDGGRVLVSDNNGATWTVITPTGNYPCAAISSFGGTGFPGYGNQLTTWTQANFSLAAYAGRTIKIKWQMGVDYSIAYEGWFIDDISVITASREIPTVFTNAGSISKPVMNNDRSLLGYDIYRFRAADEGTPSAWTQIASSISTTTYSDNDWATTEAGTYKWAVKAIYSGDLPSVSTVSNSLIKLGAPTDLLTGMIGANLHIAWTGDPLTTSYRVYGSTVYPVEITPTNLLSTTTSSYYDYAVATNDNMYFTVIAVKSTREEVISHQETLTTKPGKIRNHK